MFKYTQAYLKDIRQNAPELRERSGNIGFLSALASDLNERRKPRLQSLVDGGDGKCRTAIITKRKRPCKKSCYCNPGNCPTDGRNPEDDRSRMKFEVKNQCGIQPIKFNDEYIRCLDKSRAQLINEEFSMDMDLWREALNEKLIAEVLEKHIGGTKGSSGPTGQTVKIPLYKTDGTINPMGMVKLKRIFRDMNVVGNPYVVGAGIWQDYADLKSIACCNAGFNVSNQPSPFMMGYDSTLASLVMGSSWGYNDANNVAIAFAPGALGLYYFNKNRGDFRYDEGMNHFWRTTITDPVTGWPLDYYGKNDGCDNLLVWANMNYSLYAEDDAYHQCDELYGTNDIVLIEAICSDETVCVGNVIPTCCKPTANFTATMVAGGCRTYTLDAKSSVVGADGENCGTSITMYRWRIPHIGYIKGAAGEPILGMPGICGTYDCPIVTFAECGDHEISLSVVDDNGCPSTETKDVITVSDNCPPPDAPCPPEEEGCPEGVAEFDATSDYPQGSVVCFEGKCYGNADAAYTAGKAGPGEDGSAFVETECPQ